MATLYKNNIMKFLAGRPVADIAMRCGVTRQTFYYWINGERMPHKLRMTEFLTILGEPWGRVISEKEVWGE